MTDRDFQQFIIERVEQYKPKAVAAEFGVSRTTVYNWQCGDKPATMAVMLAEAIKHWDKASNVGRKR